MRGNQIRDQILLQPEALVHLSVLLVEGQKNLFARLAHVTEYLRRNMLRRDFERSADVIAAKFLDEFVRLRVRHQIVIADTGTNEYFFDPIKVSYCPQDI